MKKMSNLLAVIMAGAALLLAPGLLKAQTISAISGKVVNAKNERISGNVLLLSAADSSFITGAVFNDTAFKITNINRSEVLLKLTSLAFPDTVMKVVYNGQNEIDLGTIIMGAKNSELAVVTVVSKTPLVRYAPNGNVDVNVANTVLSTSSSVVEILSKSPNVIVNNGQISVLGKGEAIIYLNGRQITSEQLSSISTSQVLKIEIIPNPSSRYDAEGKAVINIITKSRADEGIMGSLSQHVTYTDFAGTNTQSFLDLSYAKGKFSLVGNYNLLLGKSREFLHTIRTRPDPAEYMRSDLTTDWRRKYNNYSNYGLGVQYAINNKSNITLAYNGYLEDLGGYVSSSNTIVTNSDNSFYTSRIDKDDVKTNNSLMLNYNRAIDSLGSVLFIGSQYSHYKSDIGDFITENSKVNGTDGLRNLKNNVDHDISISSSQIDYTKVLRANTKLDMGAKFSYVNTESATEFLIAENGGGFERDDDLSSNFRYIEKISAGYMTYSSVINRKINFAVGVRGEWTTYDLNTSVSSGKSLEDNYFNVFPNVQMNTTVSKKLRLRASYVSRITRPRYQALNPFVVYQDPFTTIEGNPNLIPEKIHAFEVGANYEKYDIRVGYNYSIDPIDAAALRGTAPNSYVLKAINLDKGHSYFVSVSRPINTKWWTAVNTINISYSKLIDNKYAFDFIEPRPQIYLYTSNTFNVNNLFKIQLLAWYWGRKQYGLYDDYDRYLVMLGLEKDFFQNKLKGRIVINDIFRRTNASGVYGVGQTDIYYNRTFNNNYFRFIATWNFGKLKKSTYKIRSTGQPENIRAN
jgi:hypothetical protein